MLESRLLINALDALQDGIALVNADDRIVFVNRAWRRLLPSASPAGDEPVCANLLLRTAEMTGDIHFTGHGATPPRGGLLLTRTARLRNGRPARLELHADLHGRGRTFVLKNNPPDLACTDPFGLANVAPASLPLESCPQHEDRDALTGLLNRRGVLREARILMHAFDPAAGQRIACFMVDLDHFRAINDTFGRQNGDRLLCAVGRRLRETVRDRDVLGRVGGEEFVLVAAIEHDSKARSLGERLRGLVASVRIMAECQPISTTASVGVVVRGRSALPPERLIANADEALSVSKKSGRNRTTMAMSPFIGP